MIVFCISIPPFPTWRGNFGYASPLQKSGRIVKQEIFRKAHTVTNICANLVAMSASLSASVPILI